MLGYLGPQGTFSQAAAEGYLNGGNEEMREFPSIYSLITAVETDVIDKAVVPIENSIEGSVNTTLDALAFDVNLYITDEYILSVKQNLIVKRGFGLRDITRIISHPQAIGQCSRLIEKSFPDVKIEYTASTSEAGKIVSEGDGSTALIGSESCAALYGLEILIGDCGDEKNNSTRFVILGKKPNMNVTGRDKSSIVFALEDKPGTLYRALALFESAGINLVKIESRPLKKELGKYIFFIDIDGNIDNPSIYFALDAVRNNTLFYKFLGSYPKF